MPSQYTASTKVIKLRLEDHSIPKVETGTEIARIPLACITPLALIHPLLTAPYMSPAATYTLLSARNASWNWEAPLAPLMRWLRASLYQMCPGVPYLPPLEMYNHITVVRQTLQRQLIPRIPAGPATPAPAPTYIVHQSQQVFQAALAKKKSPTERWDLQAASLYQIADIQGPEELSEIWQTLSPLTKEKAQPAFEIARRESARALRCKPPPSHTCGGSPHTRTPLLHQRSQICERHSQYLPFSGPFPLSRVQGLHGHHNMGHGVGRQHNDLLHQCGCANAATEHPAHCRLGSGSKDARSVAHCDDSPASSTRAPTNSLRTSNTPGGG